MSATVAERAAMRRRLDDAVTRSRVLCVYSGKLLTSSKTTRETAEQSRLELVARRVERAEATSDARADGEVRSFAVDGVIDGQPAHARYQDGQLWCSAEVAERAEVVVSMGETFDPGDGGPEVLASLSTTPTAALLTVMRSFSQVSSVELRPSRSPTCGCWASTWDRWRRSCSTWAGSSWPPTSTPARSSA